MPELDVHMHEHLIVYGTLKPGGKAFYLIEDDVEPINGEIFLWGVLKNYKDIYPAFLVDSNSKSTDILCTLLRITNPNLEEFYSRLDRFEGHPFIFFRRSFEVAVSTDPFGDEEPAWVEAAMYVGRPEIFEPYPAITNGVWQI